MDIQAKKRNIWVEYLDIQAEKRNIWVEHLGIQAGKRNIWVEHLDIQAEKRNIWFEYLNIRAKKRNFCLNISLFSLKRWYLSWIFEYRPGAEKRNIWKKRNTNTSIYYTVLIYFGPFYVQKCEVEPKKCSLPRKIIKIR